MDIKDPNVIIDKKYKPDLLHRFNPLNASDPSTTGTRFIDARCPLCRTYYCYMGHTKLGIFNSPDECPFSRFSSQRLPGCTRWIRFIMKGTSFHKIIQYQKVNIIYWLENENKEAKKVLKLFMERAAKYIKWEGDIND